MRLVSDFKNKYLEVEKALDEADKEAEDPNTKFLTHEEVFEKIRKILKN